MARIRNSLPSYLPHKQSGKARAVWTDTVGIRHFRMLPGSFDSPESKTAFARLQLELAAAPVASSVDPVSISVCEILLAYLEYASKYYVDADGTPSKEVGCLKSAIKPVHELYGDLPAIQFGPLALKAVRQRMVDTDLCRGLVNRRIDRVKRVFKWAVAEELIPVTTYEALRTLTGLRRGRTEARESEPVKPVVNATLPHLPRHVRAIVELMQHTGMRPSEACAMTLGRIDRSGEIWVYRPLMHKTAYHGKDRVIPLGPKARKVLIAFLGDQSLDPHASIFSPMRQREERFVMMRENRKTKVQPTQIDRKKKKPKKIPTDRYIPAAVSHAVSLAAEKAKTEHWHPYQLRHSFATRVRKEQGLEAAQVVLGHSRADVTQVYAERNEELAATVAAKIG